MPTERTITDRKLQRLAARVNHQLDRRAAAELAAIRDKSPAELDHVATRSFSLQAALLKIDQGRV